MEFDGNREASALVASTLHWWHDAGVDTLVGEVPRCWVGDAVAAVERQPARLASLANTTGSAPSVPMSLPLLRSWLLETVEIPDFGPVKRRLPALGEMPVDLMILTDMPEADDAEAGGLFAGSARALIDRMLSALGHTRDTVYIAAMLPGRTPSGDFDPATRELVETAARAHVRLASPSRLWLMGNAASRAILGIDDVRAAGRLHDVNLDGVMVKAIATAHPRLLGPTRKELRARVWADMQRLLEKDER